LRVPTTSSEEWQEFVDQSKKRLEPTLKSLEMSTDPSRVRMSRVGRLILAPSLEKRTQELPRRLLAYFTRSMEQSRRALEAAGFRAAPL
jgi:hypothetical protein